jgi:hypothetical protein
VFLNNNNFLFKSGVSEDIAKLDSRLEQEILLKISNVAAFIHFMQIIILTLSLF